MRDEVSKRAAIEREYWTRLKVFAASGEVIAFYRLYVDYLDWAGVTSSSRQAIRIMAVETIRLLEGSARLPEQG